MFPPPPSQPSPQVQPPQPNPQGMGMKPMGGSSNPMGPSPQVQPPMQFGGGKPMQPQVQPPMQMGGGKPMQPQVQPPMYPAAPQAQKMSQYGRGNDTMLMHVTPSEVQGLQGLAQMGGASLTTNPMTGLPEAGVLEDLLPTILGVAGMALGIPPMLTAAVVGGGTGIATGSLEKGLMAGLGAFGGSSLGAGLGLGGAGAAGASAAGSATPIADVIGANSALAPSAATAINPAAVSSLGANVAPGAIGGTTGATIGAGAGALPDAARAAALQSSAYPSLATNPLTSRLGSLGMPGAAAPAAAPQAPAFLTDILGQRTGQQVADFGSRFAREASKNFAGEVGPTSMYKTGAAALGAAMPVMNAMQPRYPGPEDKDDGFNYEGPYLPTERRPRFKPAGSENDSSEFRYFDDVNPYPGFQPAPRGFAAGGDVERPPVMPPAPVGPGGVISLPGSGAGGPARRITRPLGYGDQQNYGMRGGETRYEPFRPTLPPAPVVGGGGDGGAGGGTGGGSSGGGSAGGFSGGGFGGDFGDRLRSLLAQNQAGSAPRSTEFRELDQFAAGGTVDLNRGGFVVDARTVAELGNGSSSAGQEILARYGGRPVTGGGDGVSDSVPARIDGRRPARVARDEVHFSAEAVRALGKGDAKQGTKRLNALMAKAQKARQSADRGQDTKLRKAIAK